MSEAVSDLEERLREMASHDALIRTDVNIFREAADTLATLRAECTPNAVWDRDRILTILVDGIASDTDSPYSARGDASRLENP